MENYTSHLVTLVLYSVELFPRERERVRERVCGRNCGFLTETQLAAEFLHQRQNR